MRVPMLHLLRDKSPTEMVTSRMSSAGRHQRTQYVRETDTYKFTDGRRAWCYYNGHVVNQTGYDR